MSVVHDTFEKAKGAVQGVMEKAVALAPDSWIPGGVPDPLIREQHGKVGKPISRVDGPLKVAGKATFSAEYTYPDMLYAAVAFSTIAKGKITSIDTTSAEAAPGVALVMTHENMPSVKPMPLIFSQSRAAGPTDLPILSENVEWNGQPIAVVLADTQEQADHAKSLIRVTYDEQHAHVDHVAAREAGTKLAEFQGQPLQVKIEDAQAALDAAPHKVDQRYFTPRHNHNPIELHGVTVKWDGDKLRIHDASQGVQMMAWTAAHMFGVDEKDVHVTSPYVGGGFGSKTMWYHQPLAIAAAKLAERPVRLNLSREGVYRSVGGRTLTEQRCAIAAEADGTFTSIIHTGVTPMTPHNQMPEPFILPTMSVYGSKAMHLEVRYTELDMIANTFMRAPGEAVGTFGLESAIDELAHEMGMDPIELRLKNEPELDPIKNLPHSQRDTEKMFRDGAERFGWSERQAPGTRREGEWLIGMGVATATYPYHRMPGGAARITLSRLGHAEVEIAAHEMGMGTATAHKQVTADRLGLELEQVDFQYGDSLFPGDVLAGGSQQTASIGASVIAAQHKLYAELIKLAGNDSPLAGLKADEVGGFRGGIASLEDASRHESYASILNRAQRDEVVVEADAPAPLELQHWSMHSHGAIFVEVAVNAVTGETRVRRMLGSFDCGRILNPKTAASQFRGGMIMGLGLALTEETMVDERTGRIMNPSLAEYHVPVHLDVPHIEVMWTDIPDPHAPMGARGIGEIGITGVGAAVANAVFNATGKRVRDLPLTLDKVL